MTRVKYFTCACRNAWWNDDNDTSIGYQYQSWVLFGATTVVLPVLQGLLRGFLPNEGFDSRRVLDIAGSFSCLCRLLHCPSEYVSVALKAVWGYVHTDCIANGCVPTNVFTCCATSEVVAAPTLKFCRWVVTPEALNASIFHHLIISSPTTVWIFWLNWSVKRQDILRNVEASFAGNAWNCCATSLDADAWNKATPSH